MNGNGEVLDQFEKSVIGAVFVDNRTLAELPRLEVGDFFSPKAQLVFTAMRALEGRNEPIDPNTVGAELERMGKFGAVDFGYLGECALNMPDAQNAAEYARHVRQEALHRRALIAASEVLTVAKKGQAHGAELVGRALELFSRLDAEEIVDPTMTVKELVRERFKQLEAIAEDLARGIVRITGYATGVRGLDEKLGGWQPGIVSIVAARPGHGKSSLGLATTDACTEAGVGVHVFSLEDPRHSYADRILSRLSRVPAEKIRAARYDRGDMENLTAARAKLWSRDGWIVDDRSGLSAPEVIRSVRRHRRENGTKLVIVDYLQLLARPDGAHNRHEAIGDNLHALADAARNDGMAYVVMSQLNREIEKRHDKRPQLADMRESGTIEERAKSVVGLYLGHKYGGEPQMGIDDEGGELPSVEDWRRTIQLLVLKNSNGDAPHTVFANWHGPTTRMW